MPSQPAIPPLLLPYLTSSPFGSLILLTSTLGATSNWLVLRFVVAALKDQGLQENDGWQPTGQLNGRVKIALLSWLRDAKFWKDGLSRLGISMQHVTIVDTLNDNIGLRSVGLAATEAAILQTISNGENDRQLIFILDGLDFLLAATATPVQAALDTIGEMRHKAHSVIVTACSDSPLLESNVTPMEMAHAALAMTLVRQATIVMSVRELDTGGAKDVSGVLRITKGGGSRVNANGENIEESECLYHIEGDGGVRVFEKGA